ncbi:hypothetical protein HDU96_009549 [Phlyctochytrium bullatum]|nr:hypothetical protein HDU96_009549 [Phlyctochytrium bullatum]
MATSMQQQPTTARRSAEVEDDFYDSTDDPTSFPNPNAFRPTTPPRDATPTPPPALLNPTVLKALSIKPGSLASTKLAAVAAAVAARDAGEEDEATPRPSKGGLGDLPPPPQRLLNREESSLSVTGEGGECSKDCFRGGSWHDFFSSTYLPGGKKNFKAAGQAVIAAQQLRPKRSGTLPAGDGKLTAAQAMTRLTGAIFDGDHQIPPFLRGPVVQLVEASDQVDKTVAGVRDSVGGLLTWEALVSCLQVASAMVLAYVLGWLGFSFAWVVVLLVTVGNAFGSNMSRLRKKVAEDTTKDLAVRRLETESETAEWLNKFMQRLWRHMEPSLSAQIKGSVESSLKGTGAVVAVFTLGTASPRFEIVRTVEKTSDDVHIMDMDMNFTPIDEDDFSKREKELGDVKNSKIELKVYGVPILVTNIEFSGRLRIGIKYMTRYPHIKLIEYSFLEAPLINFKLRPLKGTDWMDFGLAGLIKGVVNNALAEYIEPHKQIVDMEAMFNGSGSDVPVGVLKVTIFEAKDLKNRELGGISDPYAVVKIGGEKEVARTSTVNQSLAPYWGETYYIPVMRSWLTLSDDLPPTATRPDELRIHIFDENKALNDTSMGFTEPLLLSQWVKLLDAAEGDRKAAKVKAAIAAAAAAAANGANAENSEEKAGGEPGAVPPAASEMGSPSESVSNLVKEKVMGKAERNRLITEWGTPFPEDSDVWKPVMHEEKGKPKGEIRLDLVYFPLPKSEAEEEAAAAAAAPEAEEEETKDPAAKKAKDKAKEEAAKLREQAVKARREAEAKLTTGVLTVTVHQAKELPCGKSANPCCTLLLSNLPRYPVSPSNVLGSTPAARRTNNPVWDHEFVFFVSDSAEAEMEFRVMDGEKMMGMLTVPVKEVIKAKAGHDASADWFKLPGSASGKVRITFKWQPLDMENAHKNAEIVRKEPIGMVRINLLEAKGVANVEAFRKSDPYAKLTLSRRSVGATHVKENTLDPVWNELFYAVCYSRNEPLRIELFDYNKVKKDLGLGKVEFYLEELLNPDSWSKPAGEGKENVGESQDLAGGELVETSGDEVDMKRLNWLSKQEKDGLKVTVKGGLIDVWAPIYITRSPTEDAEESKEANGSRTLNGAPLLSASTTALNLVGIGSGAKPGQKGHIHFEVEFLEVAKDCYVRPKAVEELATLVKMHHEAVQLEETRKAEKAVTEAGAPVGEGVESKGKKTLRTVDSMADLLRSADAEESHQMLLNYVTPMEVVNRYPSGIVRLRVHEVRALKSAGSYYVDVVVDEEVVGSTRIQRKSINPIWDASFDLFLKNVLKQKLKIQVRCAKEDSKKNSDDAIAAVFDSTMVGVAGLRNAWVTLHPNGWKDEVVGEMRMSVGYAPVALDSDEDGSKNMGILHIDVVDAVHLEAVDASGTSDPYCIISVNDRPIHRTKVHKKQLNVNFNEIVHAKVKSRYRSSLTVTVRDHNTIGKHTTLGTVTLQLSKINPEILYVGLLPLEGARGGFIRLRFLFLPRKLADWELEDSVDRSEGKEGNRFAKFTKGLGSSAVDAIASSIDTIGGKSIPIQHHEGPNAEELAKQRNYPVKMLGDAPSTGASTENVQRSRDLGSVEDLANSNLEDLIKERHRTQLFGTVSLTVESARNLKPVDVGGTSDPYVKVIQLVHGKEKVLLKTRALKKTLDPVWSNESVSIKVPPTTVRVMMRDKNMFAESKPMGEVDVDFSALLKNGKSDFDVWLPLGLGGMGEVHLIGRYTPEAPKLMTSGPTVMPGMNGLNVGSSQGSLRDRSRSQAGSVASLPTASAPMSRAESRSSMLGVGGSRESLTLNVSAPSQPSTPPEGDHDLSPSMSVASSISSLNEHGNGSSGEKRERRRVFTFSRKNTKSADKE